MRFGVQIYGMNPILLQDPDAFFKRLSDIGYRYIEPCVMTENDKSLSHHVWTVDELSQRKPMLEKYGLKIDSVHIFTPDILTDTCKVIDIAKQFGIRQIVMPCPVLASKEEYASILPELIDAGKRFLGSDVELLMHNCGEESISRIDGMCAYEWVLRHTDGVIGAQPDVGWLIYGGVDPEAFLWRNEDLIKSIHYKDMKSENGIFTETEIGTGLLDMTACMQFARYKELIQYADRDESDGDFLEEISRTYDKFNTLQYCRENTSSILCIMNSVTGEVRELERFDGITVEAPNWYQKDADYLYFNSDGHIIRYKISTGEKTVLDTGSCIYCNNDHVLSADGREIAVSNSDPGSDSKVYIIPIEGGTPKLITDNCPSYLHGWSPDGETLVYCAFRDYGKGTEADVYSVSRNGGEEVRLTENAGFNDGPEFSPDGKKILFISTRSGLMQNWVMNSDGTEPTQLTATERNNWFGHYSPDGKKIVYLSYSKDGLDPIQHLPNMKVQLRLMNADGSDDHTILEFFGGQGSINVNSWCPDSIHFAFVKYELSHK